MSSVDKGEGHGGEKEIEGEKEREREREAMHDVMRRGKDVASTFSKIVATSASVYAVYYYAGR